MSFESISHEQWLEKIKKELKQDDLSAFDVSLTPTISINPFFGRKPKDSEGNRIEKNWLLKQVYFTSSLDNSILLEDLVGGINTVEIRVDTNTSDWGKLLENVIFSYIELTFVIEDKANLSKDELNDQLKSFDFTPDIKSKELIFKSDAIEFVDQLKSHFSTIVNLLDRCDSLEERENLFKSFRIDRKVSGKIIAELAIAEAIEIISHNICRGFGLKERSVELHAICEIEENETLERNYIDLSTKALTAGLASFDAINIGIASTERASFHHRISRNIHHLLIEESVLNQSRTAYKGSYQIQEISTKISHEIWDSLS